MAVSILAIKFNHDTNAATHDALNIRIDATGTVNVPEWTGGETVASQSPAAYAIKAAGKNSITMQAGTWRYWVTLSQSPTTVR